MAGTSRCPVCREPVRENTTAPPFCGSRCRLIDLGNWLGDRYRIPGDDEEIPPAEREDHH